MGQELTLFLNTEEAWFWFMQANRAKQDGARITANQGNVIRPCEPSDILKILERLRRHRRLDMNHLRVMRHYGDRMLAPDAAHPNEALSAKIWNEAMVVLGDVLIAKDIVQPTISAEIIDFNARLQAVSSW